MATIWKGAVSFGLVNIPVRAEPATRDVDAIHFRQLDRTNSAPVKMKRVNALTGSEVAWSDIVKGYEYAKDQFIVIDQTELDTLKVPTGSALDLIAFVDAGEIDPRHYDTPYFLIPEPTATRAYALLREAIRDSGVVGVGTVTMRQRTHVVTVRVLEQAIVMDVIRPVSSLVDPASLNLPGADSVRAPEKAMAEQLIAHLRAPFDTSTFRDEYQEALRALVEAKLDGTQLPSRADRDTSDTQMVDLMARLKASLTQSKPASRVVRSATAESAGGRKAAATEKPAAKRRRSA